MISRSSLELRFALPCDDWKFVVDGTPLNSQQCSANAPIASRIVYFAADHLEERHSSAVSLERTPLPFSMAAYMTVIKYFSTTSFVLN
jgi:hypothetical protein